MDKDPGSRIPRGGVDRGAELRVPRQPGGAGRGGPKLYAILIIAWRLCEQPDCSAHRCVNATSRTSPRPSDWAWSIARMTWGAAFGKVCKAQGARCKVRQVRWHAALSLGGPPSPTPIFFAGGRRHLLQLLVAEQQADLRFGRNVTLQCRPSILYQIY
jgi:hypothetical protein